MLVSTSRVADRGPRGLSIGGPACKAWGVCIVRAKFISDFEVDDSGCRREAK
jgi:hypothetical protein